jgi:hypothetical protein
MTMAINQQRCDVTSFAAAIARSPITASAGRRGSGRLPDGYDEIDAAILVWIAAEARCAARTFTLM